MPPLLFKNIYGEPGGECVTYGKICGILDMRWIPVKGKGITEEGQP